MNVCPILSDKKVPREAVAVWSKFSFSVSSDQGKRIESKESATGSWVVFGSHGRAPFVVDTSESPTASLCTSAIESLPHKSYSLVIGQVTARPNQVFDYPVRGVVGMIVLSRFAGISIVNLDTNFVVARTEPCPKGRATVWTLLSSELMTLWETRVAEAGVTDPLYSGVFGIDLGLARLGIILETSDGDDEPIEISLVGLESFCGHSGL